MVLGIAPVEIIDRQLPFEYTITSRSTDVVVHLPTAPAADSAANVLAEWNALYDAYNEVACLILGCMTPELHRQFKNYSPYEMLQELKSMFKKQAGVERFDLNQTFHACKKEEGKPIVAYVLQMKGYVDQLEHLGYMLLQDFIVGRILNGLTKKFARFVRNYNMHNMGKTIGELHAMLIEYEKGLPKKAEIPQVMMIKCGKIQKSQKKSLKAKGNGKANGKEHLAKDDICHHCKEVGHWKRNSHVYLAELLKKKKQVGFASSSDNCHYAPSITRGVVSVHRMVENRFVQCFTDFKISVSKNNVFYFNAIPSNGIYEIDMHDLVPNVNSIYNVSTKRTKHNLDSTYLWYCRLAHISASYFIKFTDDYSRYGYVYLLKHKHEVFETFKVFKNEVKNQLGKTIKALRSDRGGEYISQEFKDYLKACEIVQQLTPPYTPQHNDVSERRNRTFLDMVRSMMNLTTMPLSFWDYALESATRILNMVSTKKALVKRDTPDKLQQRSVKCIFIGCPKETMGYYFYFPPENKIVVASDIPMEVEDFEPPQEEVIPIRRSKRTHRAPNRSYLNVEVEEHTLGNLNEPASYKVAMLDSDNNKWIDTMNAEI
uniref:Integrase catalytic domain-containing protein n=1 Tax=Tanacetum cinerariifolium TaxID=118510 RepID=A0A6L2NYY3_TANCI|nr:hypothetical protein [Tanacetum cinerariifolium]